MQPNSNPCAWADQRDTSHSIGRECVYTHINNYLIHAPDLFIEQSTLKHGPLEGRDRILEGGLRCCGVSASFESIIATTTVSGINMSLRLMMMVATSKNDVTW